MRIRLRETHRVSCRIEAGSYARRTGPAEAFTVKTHIFNKSSAVLIRNSAPLFRRARIGL